MGRAPCCSKVGLHRGPWTPREDTMLINYIQTHGEGHWRSLPKKAGLLRCGKSCRLRWMNYLRPDIKRGNITPEEDDLIIRMHSLLGNRWSLIAGRLPGRTDNEIKNYWNTHLRKKLKTQGTDPDTKKHSPSSNQSLVIKKKKKNATNKKPDNTRSKPKRTEPEKQKIHLPKPVRVTSLLALPRKDRFEGNISQGSDINNNNVYNDHNNNGVNFLVGDDNGNLVNGSHLDRCESIAPAASIARDNNSLERLYEEYLQLLETDHEDQVQLDSFAESLLV